MSILGSKTYAIVDVETTGASPVFDRVIEIGILRIENGEIVKTFNSLIDPQTSLHPSIERITGIQAEELSGKPTFEDLRDQISELLEGAIFVAHNARFDYGFIKNELKRSGTNFNAKCLCTVRLSRKLFPNFKKHDLSSVIDRFNLECINRHRAYDDAAVLWDFLKRIETMGKEKELEEAIVNLLKANTLPQFLNDETIKALPEGPGVYIFYGEDNEVLYVGKSKNVRFRVLSHFSNDHGSSKEMHLCQQTTRVVGQETAGELSALLLESKLVKELYPLYNRQLRRQSELVIARRIKTKKYPSVVLERANSILEDEYKNILGIFKSISQAKTYIREGATERKLCPQVLGLEKSKGACFNHQIGKCEGACVEKETVKDFTKRFEEMFKKRRLRSWPFKGPILIKEKKNDEENHSFVLDNWCLLKDVITSEDDIKIENYSPKFDYDSYKILVRYLRNPLNKRNIRPLRQKEIYTIQKETEKGEQYVYID
jgi:DNA polymerase-3 subunit epsilon